MLAAALGFVTFLLLLPARAESSDVDRTSGGADQLGAMGTHCFTHLGWQDVLGPWSCSRAAAAVVGVAVWLLVRAVVRLRVR